MHVQFLYFFCIFLHVSTASNYEETVNYYVNLVEDGIEKALNFELPVDASMHRPTNPNIIELDDYDFVIIGAGAAGSAIAGRLSEVNNWRILMLEAGMFENNFTNIPGMYYYDRASTYNWAFTSTPQTTCCQGMVDKKCAYPRGKAVGGTTILNGLIYSRGNKIDYDRWEAAGNPGWSFNDVLPYYKQIENSKINGDPGFHGTGGPLNIEYHKNSSRQVYAFLDANVELGINVVDYNGAHQLGVSRIQSNIINGSRLSASRAFLEPILPRENLEILTNSYVTKILVDKQTKKARGVIFTRNGSVNVVKARKEIILSAGTFGSPQILQLSGIGPENYLNSLGIKTVKNLPVGNNLQDHPTFYGIYFETNYTEPVQSVRQYIEEYLRGTGLYTVAANLDGIGYYQTNLTDRLGYPDLELIMVPSPILNNYTQTAFRFTNETYDGLWRNVNGTNSFIIYVVLLRPESKGTVRLASKNPFLYPSIDSRFLSDFKNRDIDTLYAGIEFVVSLLKTRAFRKMNATLGRVDIPACRSYEYLSKGYWYCLLRQLTTNVYHPVGTCKMGPNPKTGGVVDSRLRVHGIRGLRVADASVLPFSFSGHPAAATMMVGYRVSDFIKQEYIHYK